MLRMPIDRFLTAQANSRAGYSTALHELRAGEKLSHWIWYIFPQLQGMGRSSVAVQFALADASEAIEYLANPTLRARLTEAVATVRGQIEPPRSIPLRTLMGGGIDALKLVSSLTLFERVAASDPEVSALRTHAAAVLEVAGTQGYPRCAFTLAALRAV